MGASRGALTCEWLRGSGGPFYSIFGYFTGDRVAVEPEHIRGGADVALGALERPGDEHLLEFTPRVVVMNALVEHLGDEPFHLVPHGRLLQVPVRQAAERFDVFLARAGDDFIGKRRHRRLLVPADLFQVVAHVLLVETGHGAAGVVLILGPEAR